MKLLYQSAGQRRRQFCASFAAIAVGLGTMGAVAYACSGGGGEATNLSAKSGTHGKSLAETTSATGGALTPNHPGFAFRYAHPGDATACHHEVAIGPTVKSTPRGDINPTKRTIPNLGAVAGTGEACWATGTMNNAEISQVAPITVN